MHPYEYQMGIHSAVQLAKQKQPANFLAESGIKMALLDIPPNQRTAVWNEGKGYLLLLNIFSVG